ncbi:FIGNL1-interacting regulator of recombination and mitosis-like [Branchiostoma floridae x Branchiostoma japonicum]
MSQNGLLHDLEGWGPDTCAEKLHTVLPKLIAGLSGDKDTRKQSAYFSAICKKFLAHVDINDVEVVVYADAMPKVCDVFDGCLTAISELLTQQSSTPSSQSSQGTKIKEGIIDHIQVIDELLGSLEQCVVHAVRTDHPRVLDSHSLVATSLHVIKGTFSHCKDSHESYGKVFPLVSESLSCLFKKAYSLQKVLMSLIDKLQLPSDSSEEDVTDMVAVCQGFHVIGCTVSGVDASLLVTTWKFLAKQLTKHKEVLKNHIDMAPLVRTLCSEVGSNCKYCVELAAKDATDRQNGCGDQKLYTRTLKICRFFMQCLMCLVKDYNGYLGSCIKEIFHIILEMQSLLPPSLSAPPLSSAAAEEMKATLLVGIEPMIQHLLDNRDFLQLVAARNKDLPSHHNFPLCLVQLIVMDLLPKCSDEQKDQWISPKIYPEDEPRDSILVSLFNTLKKCYTELTLPVYLPGVMCNGMPQRDVSLYEHVCTHLCGFAASLPARHFPVLETCLLGNVLGADLYCALAATDVWCFVARYGTAELCEQHVHLLTKLLCQLPNSCQHLQLHLLLRRLVPLMAEPHQEKFVQTYPPAQHPSLWVHLPPVAFVPKLRGKICAEGVSYATPVCQKWLGLQGRTLGTLPELHLALCVLCNMYSVSVRQTSPLQSSAPVLHTVSRLWDIISASGAGKHRVVEVVAIKLVELTGYLLGQLVPEDVIKVLSRLSQWLKTSPPQSVKLSITQLLGRAGRLSLPPSPQQTQLQELLAHLFSTLLQDNGWVVHHHALEAFSTFAEETPYESILPKCLQNESVKSRATDFIKGVPFSSSDVPPWNAETITQQQRRIEAFQEKRLADISSRLEKMESAPSVESPEQPSAKRVKKDTGSPTLTNGNSVHPKEEDFRTVTDSLKKDIGKLEEFSTCENPPEWYQEELKSLHQRLGLLLEDS